MMRVNSERGGSGLTVISISLDIGCLTKDSSVYHFLIAVKVETFEIILMFMVFLLSYLSHASLIIRHSEDSKLYLYDILHLHVREF